MNLDSQQRQQIKQRIAELQAELQQALEQSLQAGATVELDQTLQGRLSRMDALQGQAMAKAASQRMQRQLQALKRACEQLEQPDFGLCQECDEPIAWARLHFDPGVTTCIACASAAEEKP